MIGILIFYGISAVCAYGYAFGYMQEQYPDQAVKNYSSDVGVAALVALTGPIGLVMLALTGSMVHGMKFL